MTNPAETPLKNPENLSKCLGPLLYGKCVAKLSATKDVDLTKITGIDPGVSVSIKVLSSREDQTGIDFSKIQGKAELESATLKSMENKYLRLEPNNSTKGVPR